jgi:peptidoglycan/LPS O-acetylase OafA/YrhL
MQLVSILFIILCIVSIRFQKPVANGYAKENTDSLKGLLALSIILCHLTNCVNYYIPFFGFGAMGAMGVGTFFFLSGYALVVSSNSRQYFNGFLRKRYIKIGIPYFLMLAIYFAVIDAIGKGSPIAFFQSFFNGYPVSNSWYVFACAYCYFIFWMVFRCKRNNQSNLVSLSMIALGLAVYIFVMVYILGWDDWWYKTICCFLIGVLWGMYYEKIKAFIARSYLPCLVMSLLLVSGAYLLPAINNRVLHLERFNVWLINDIAMGITFVLFIAVFLYKFHVTNRITRFLGTISYEIYLYHGLIMVALKSIRGGYSNGNTSSAGNLCRCCNLYNDMCSNSYT